MHMGNEDRLQSFRGIVKDYIAYKLRQRNIFLAGYNVNDIPSAAACHLRRVADELIQENEQLFDSMCDQLHLTHASTYATFVGIADEIFQTGKNWGRIVAFLAFGATLAVYCVQKEDLAELLNNIVEWVSIYMEQNLGGWIDENGGWEGFINFFQMDDGSPENRQSGAWRIAAVAGLGLGALLMLACR
ncbi:apoptosis regulator R1-like [Montipora capricornis]|uniref:apoptosis regulator R1-like n=1 Tax=Montipora foliosa TaxID=591990 RepID=UPI0035F18786